MAKARQYSDKTYFCKLLSQIVRTKLRHNYLGNFFKYIFVPSKIFTFRKLLFASFQF